MNDPGRCHLRIAMCLSHDCRVAARKKNVVIVGSDLWPRDGTNGFWGRKERFQLRMKAESGPARGRRCPIGAILKRRLHHWLVA